MNHPVPVTIIGGFLGTGKTTLLNHVLSAQTGVRFAVMVNDFGSLCVDEALIKSHDGETISFANGCVCCSLGDNLVQSINALLQRHPRPQQFLIEVSGVANPKVIADVATLHPGLKRDLIITMVDAQTIMQRLADSRLTDTLTMQLQAADLVAINKCDLVDKNTLTAIDKYVSSEHNENRTHSVQAKLPYALLSSALLNHSPTDQERERENPVPLKQPSHHPEKQFYRCTIPLPAPIHRSQFESILRQHASTLLRAKGFFVNEEQQLMSVQLSGKQIEFNALTADPDGSNIPPYETHLVTIGLGALDEFQRDVCDVNERENNRSLEPPESMLLSV